jgi:hypothetical protein
LPPDPELDASSAAAGRALAHQAASGASINTTSYSVPIYKVPAHQPLVKVTLLDPWRAPGGAALAAAWNAVPLPPNAHPAAGSDKQVVVWQPSTDCMWEFWEMDETRAGWQAEWEER